MVHGGSDVTSPAGERTPVRGVAGQRSQSDDGWGKLPGVGAVLRVVQPAAVDAFDDDRDLPVREGDPVAEAVEVPARRLRVRIRERLRIRKALERRDRLPEEAVGAAHLVPVRDHLTDVRALLDLGPAEAAQAAEA